MTKLNSSLRSWAALTRLGTRTGETKIIFMLLHLKFIDLQMATD
jgi:hypothetical protein